MISPISEKKNVKKRKKFKDSLSFYTTSQRLFYFCTLLCTMSLYLGAGTRTTAYGQRTEDRGRLAGVCTLLPLCECHGHTQSSQAPWQPLCPAESSVLLKTNLPRVASGHTSTASHSYSPRPATGRSLPTIPPRQHLLRWPVTSVGPKQKSALRPPQSYPSTASCHIVRVMVQSFYLHIFILHNNDIYIHVYNMLWSNSHPVPLP